MELLDYEKKHLEYLDKNASECALFLKKNNEFPIDKSCKVALFGSGARNTIKGGTGSGDIYSRTFKNIEDTLIESGFLVTTTKWLDEYDDFKKGSKKEYIKDGKRLGRQNHIMPLIYSMGFFEEEKNYSIDIKNYDGDISIYVLSRNSGEGNDRRNIKGDVKLSDKEVEDILYLNKRYKKFMLVLNVGGVVDLSRVLEVSNILLLSQLGAVTSSTLVDIILGVKNPTGKLTTTWTIPEEYPFFNEFNDRDDTYYKEGIYVGYRYFSSLNMQVLFPFGYGLSYSSFDISIKNLSLDKMNLKIDCLVKNTSNFKGKEVVQAYVSKPNTILDNPYIELVDYKKTKELSSNEEEIISLNIDFTKLSSYDESRAYTILQKGEYIVRIGNSSINLMNVCKCILNEEVILERLQNKLSNNSFKDLKIDKREESLDNLKEFVLDPSDIVTRTVEYKKDEYIDSFIETLSNKELARLCLGHYKKGLAAIVGSSCEHVIGGAGETTLSIDKIDKSLTMADGPAGLRIKPSYGKDNKGIYDTINDPMMEKMLDFIPKIAGIFIKPPKNRKGEIFYQPITAIPIGTALAQSFNDKFIYECGLIVASEMKLYNVDLWLAPAINIHRNILCGRNYEYYSEDPYLSYKVASNIIKSVESNDGLGVTIKHFACNNQEFNRNNNNSHVSERALREIYLKGFELCIKESNPKAIMTSYNLINGVHTSESYELINDILRCEWGYQGLVMSDWIQSGRSFCSRSIYPAPYASNNIKAGNDLTMPGSPKDYKVIISALKKNMLTKEDLLYSASRIYRSILKQKH